MNTYEMMCVFDPAAGSAAETSEMVSQLLSSYQAEISEKQDLGLKKLAYLIDKKSEGNYWLFNFTMPGEQVDSFKKEFGMKDNLLRYMIVKKDS